jgi:tetratricopeptide (TPR) repeat protein
LEKVIDKQATDGNRLKITYALLSFLFLLSVFFLALCKVEDTDTWMHLSFGRLIWDLKGLPSNEPFIYPSLDMPFLYSSWLFGLMYYVIYSAFNFYGLILLKAVTITAAFFILVRDSLRPYKNYAVTILVATIIVMMSRHRFVDRPDIFLMVFLSFSIFSLNAYIYDNKKYIYILPVIHLLWANYHSSINLMFVPFSAFIIGGIIQRYINKYYPNIPLLGKVNNEGFFCMPTTVQLKTIILIFILSFAASLINPFFIEQYFYGAMVLSTEWYKQEITELIPPTWQTIKWPYILTVFTLITFILNRKRLSLIHLILVIPFMILSFTAVRFIFILGIVSGPILSRNIASYLDNVGWGNRFDKKSVIALTVFIVILYTALALANVKPFGSRTKEFGFGINYYFIPEGSLRYMDKNNIKGRIFNKFEWGGYITWRDFPRRSAFIDGRGYISEDLLEKTRLVWRQPSVLDELYKLYGFESMIISYPIFKSTDSEVFSEVDLALSHPNWALVYWDDKSLVYLKRDGNYSSVVRDDEYRFVKPANDIFSIRSKLHDENYRSNLIIELKRNIAETGSLKAHEFLGFVYNEMGLYSEAINVFNAVRDLPEYSRSTTVLNGLAYAYSNLGYHDEAIRYYAKSLDIDKEAATFYNIAQLYIKKGEKKTAIRYLKEAIDINRGFTPAYPQLINLYYEFGMEDNAKKTQQDYEKARLIEEGKRHFQNGMRAYYLENRSDIAMDEFKKAIDKNPSVPSPYSYIGYIYMNTGDLETAYQYQRKAIDIDPNLAIAHYGLALVYKKQGNYKMAEKHWKKYLKIEPRGYYSRRAEEEIETLK